MPSGSYSLVGIVPTRRRSSGMLVKLREAAPEVSIEVYGGRPSGRSSPRRHRRRAGNGRLVTSASAHAFLRERSVASMSTGDVPIGEARVRPSVSS